MFFFLFTLEPPLFSYPWYADFKTAFVFKIGHTLVVEVNFCVVAGFDAGAGGDDDEEWG